MRGLGWRAVGSGLDQTTSPESQGAAQKVARPSSRTTVGRKREHEVLVEEKSGGGQPAPANVTPYWKPKSDKLSGRQIWRRECPLLRLRADNSVTQSELAHKVGLSQVRISQIEHGKSPLREDEAGKIADALNACGQTLYVDYCRWVSMMPVVGATETALAARRIIRRHSPILKRCRVAKLSVEQLCDRAGCSLTTAYNYASNPQYGAIKLQTLANIARALECSFVDLAEEMLDWQEWFSNVPAEEMLVHGSLYQERLARMGKL